MVDTNIVSSAGLNSNPEASISRKILISIYYNGHNAALSDEICKEYRCGWSHVGKTWYTQMRRHKKILLIHDSADDKLRWDIVKMIGECYHPSQAKTIWERSVKKDVPLLEIAILTDRVVLSHEHKCRDHFRKIVSGNGDPTCSCTVTKIRSIKWLRPCECSSPSYDIIGALNNGVSYDSIPATFCLIN